ncbi:hypothetical protein BN133_2632 [Cronobacter dublinensis 582]|nr:hypothetical protein BN133_2632 [Cronobacter dublinensis 582]
MRMLRHLALQALLVFMEIEPDDVFARGHGGRHGARLQLKHVFNKLMLLLAQYARERTRFHHRVDIVGSDVVFAHHRQLEDAENHIRHAVKEPHQRAEDEQTEAHRVDDTQSHGFRRNHTDAFRGQVGEENEQAGHERKGEDKAHLLGDFRRDKPDQQRVERRGERRIAHDTAKNSDGVQANLHHGEEGAGVFLHLQHSLGVDIAVIGQQLEFDFTGGGKRDLGKREKRADANETKY